MSSNACDKSKKHASIDSLKISSKNTSRNSSKHASSESILSRKEVESLQLQECKKKLLDNEQHIIMRNDNMVLKSPPSKKIIMPPTVNPEELAAATPTQRNWRGILIALLVIAAVLALIVFSIILLTPRDGAGGLRGRRPTLHHLLSDQFKIPAFNGTWISDSQLVYRDRWGGLALLNADNFTTRLLMNNSTFRELNAVEYKVSPDIRYVLLVSDVRPGWRHGTLARYHVYDLIHRNRIPLSPVEEDRAAPFLQYAEWSPAGGLVFVHNNDIYYKPRVWKTLVCRITNTGDPGVIFNGVPDFLYETEVLRLERALWFSPDGQYLLFVTYNDTDVPEYRYPWYGFDDPEPPAYPMIKSIRYPQMGSPNPVVTLNVVSLKTPKFLFPHAIQLPEVVDKTWYIRWCSWVSDRQVGVLLLNRPQNVSIVTICSATHYNCQDVIQEESDSSRWSGLGAEPVDEECGWCGGAAFVGGKSGIFTLAPTADRYWGSWRHAVKVEDNLLKPLTLGPFELTQLLGWHEARRFLYAMGTLPEFPGQRHLYRIDVPDSLDEYPPVAVCLTCTKLFRDVQASYLTRLRDDVYPPENASSAVSSWPTSTLLPLLEDENITEARECQYNRITFSRNFSYYVQECLGGGAPGTLVVSSKLGSDGLGARRLVLWDGEPTASAIASLAQPTIKVFKVKLQNQRSARVRLFLPPGFRETDDLPLPLVLEMGETVGGQLVTDRWSLQWAHYLAATRNTLVAQVDASGSGGQGEELRTEIYQKMFSIDVEDQIAVLSYLLEKLRMVDGSRVSVWGRGLGGGTALVLAAADKDNLTRCVAAADPLADLTHLSYWSERYNGYGPAAQGVAAARAAWRRAAAAVGGGEGGAGGPGGEGGTRPARRVLLAHGAADPLAPHALRIAHALAMANQPYTHIVYPDEGHNFKRSAMHFYITLEQFLDECFGPVELEDWDTGLGGLFPFRD